MGRERGAVVYTLQSTLGFVLFLGGGCSHCHLTGAETEVPKDRRTFPSSALSHHLKSSCPAGGSKEAMVTLLTTFSLTTGCQSSWPLEAPPICRADHGTGRP